VSDAARTDPGGGKDAFAMEAALGGREGLRIRKQRVGRY
jgi:hypothetical protein